MQSEFPDLGETAPEISPSELKSRLDGGESFTMVDTRRPADFEAWKITHPNLTVVNVPFTEFLDDAEEEAASELPEGIPNGTLVTSCAKGLSSTFVAEFLQKEGHQALALQDGMEGWAALYEHHILQTDRDGATVIQFHRPSTGCLSYLCVGGSEAAVIDPLRAFLDEYQQIARDHDATLEFALDTHVHADHVSGVSDLAAKTGATPVHPVGATERGLTTEPRLIEDGETLSLGPETLTARALPGHTTEMTGYEFADVLAVGDTIFLDGVARPDLEDDDAAREAAGTLWETIQSVGARGDELTIAPGHVDPTTAPGHDGSFTETLGTLRDRLQAFEESREEFVDRITSNLGAQPNNFEEIIEINLGRQSASPSESFELELGPNNCAVTD